MRMGWTIGGIAEEELRENVGNYEMRFSTANFNGYYRKFCEFYSIKLLVLFCETFDENLNLTPAVRVLISQTNEQLRFYIRWPELVTFEEMNLKGPSQFMYLMSSMAQEIKDEEEVTEESSEGI